MTVPVLFVTGPHDETVPEAGVRNFARALQAAQPARTVTVVSLEGNHCAHIAAEREQYVAALDALISAAAIDTVSLD